MNAALLSRARSRFIRRCRSLCFSSSVRSDGESDSSVQNPRRCSSLITAARLQPAKQWSRILPERSVIESEGVRSLCAGQGHIAPPMPHRPFKALTILPAEVKRSSTPFGGVAPVCRRRYVVGSQRTRVAHDLRASPARPAGLLLFQAAPSSGTTPAQI